MRESVYERYGEDTMTRGAFYFIIGSVLTYGFVATYIASTMSANWIPSGWAILLVGLGLPILGILLSASSGNPFLSFVGFNLVVIPFGLILGPVLQLYHIGQPGVVAKAATLTACVTGVMALSGTMFPNFYKSIGGALFGALTALVIVSVASIFIPALAGFTVIHYIAATIFALYIGYDMWRASETPATLDNAIDVSVSLYLDILNLFLRILSILGDADD